jgi:hypothetical protein
MTARDTYATSVATAHTSAQTGGIASLPGAPTPPGNIASWSRQSAAAAANAGTISQAQYVTIVTAIAGWEGCQIANARSTLQATGDVGPA